MPARAFSSEEFSVLERYFAEAQSTRNRLLFLLGCATGLRITELLSLRVSDVWETGAARREIYIQRQRLKGGRSARRRSVRGRRIPLAEPVRNAIAAHVENGLWALPDRHLFASRQNLFKPMSRWHAHRILLRAVAACGLNSDRISNHSYRKFFAQGIYARTKDLLLTQAALSHANPLTTARYLCTDERRVDEAILALSSMAPATQNAVTQTA